MKRDLLDIERLTDADVSALLDRTVELAGGAPCAARVGTVANLFFEPSTRTRVSFEIAARRLGLTVINIDQSGSSTTKGESLADTGRTLAAMGVDALVLRHPDDGAASSLAGALHGLDIAIVNAGDGQGAHPSQGLLDAATLAANGFEWNSLRIAIVGDIRHSRVARSDVALFGRLGVREIRLAGPPEFMPASEEMPDAIRCTDLDEALDGVDAVVCLRIQRERIGATGYPDGEAFHAQWGLTSERLAGLPKHARVLHPGPVNRGVEIADAVADGPASLIVEQVRFGVHARTAVFEWLIDASPSPY